MSSHTDTAIDLSSEIGQELFEVSYPPLGAALTAVGRQQMTKQVADIVLEAATAEQTDPALLAFTWLCESGFSVSARPNTNGQRASVAHFDVGPLQLNYGWVFKSIFKGDYSGVGLNFDEVFGTTFYEADGITPCTFSGNMVSNARLACRRLKAFHGDPAKLGYTDELMMRAVRYTGPAHQPKRIELWQQLSLAFVEFFRQYKSN